MDVFFKKPNFGELLTTVGRDGNNHIFPVAWVVVTIENKDNWSWFLELLVDDLEISSGFGLTLMSDHHKGLIEVVKEAASKASYPQLFMKIMQKIKLANPRAHEYLIKKDPKSWSRAFFQEGINYEAVENGFSECFNSVLVSVRDKPIIKMLESIRVIVMERMNTMRLIMEKWTSDICPKIQNTLELSKDQQRFWHVIPCGENKFEVRRGCDAFKVDERARTCSCRMWQLSGGKPKKKIPSENTNEVDEVETPRSVNNAIDEYGRAASTNHVMRGGKTNRGRLIPVQRLGRMERWLGMDVGTSNLIEELEPLHASYPRRKNNINDALNVAGEEPQMPHHLIHSQANKEEHKHHLFNQEQRAKESSTINFLFAVTQKNGDAPSRGGLYSITRTRKDGSIASAAAAGVINFKDALKNINNTAASSSHVGLFDWKNDDLVKAANDCPRGISTTSRASAYNHCHGGNPASSRESSHNDAPGGHPTSSRESSHNSGICIWDCRSHSLDPFSVV
ncbi:pentatricopeptide repeat-containing protein [Tanacetum coccineum]|uniref:Pentatricopeptide repeat-containing protein n=1 Tax=Tanacetum coccineum TaxID=301880 RepID=A0ABQ5G462_9ASTR